MSQGAEIPAQGRLTLLVEDALRLWKEIPTRFLSEAVDEGLILAGNFPCHSGTVAKAWRDKKPSDKLYLGAGRMNEKETQEYIRWMNDPNRDEPKRIEP